ncbi:MAG TPA: SpoIIE family protein phosphatase [Mycobacteriales bacterium]|nr:SpoIIE family protein phosphatase [Mycobacteriales bacterium]
MLQQNEPDATGVAGGGGGESLEHAVQELALAKEPDAASRARRFAVQGLEGMPDELIGDTELVVAELVTNALLHGKPPVRVRLTRRDDGVRVEVFDQGARPPMRIRNAGQAMTGRGLELVAALSREWGADQEDGGKVVWAELPALAPEPGQVLSPALYADLLSTWDDSPSEDELFVVELGDVPTDLLLEAKSHVDNLVREFVLASSGAAPQPAAPGAGGLQALVQSVVHDFAAARTQIKEQALTAVGRGAAMTHLELRLPASAADAGERYLAALDESDRYARAARLLTLEAPPVHKVFRRWYVEALIEQLRGMVSGATMRRPPTFAERLAEEFTALAPMRQTAARLSMVQKVTAELAAAATIQDVAQTVVDNALEILRATSAVVYLLGEDGMLRSVRRPGVGDEDLARAYDTFPADSDLPGGIVLRTGLPLVFRSGADMAAQFPQLTGNYPEDTRLLVAPLIVGEHRLGVLALRFHGTELVDEDTQLSMLTTLAGVTSQALERAVATSAASEAAERLALLAEASVVLASSLDHRVVLQAIADLVVPRLADWCVIQLLVEGALTTVGITHFDRERTLWARSLQDKYPTDMTLPTGAPNVIRTGASELYVAVPDELLTEASLDSEHLDLLRGLSIHSAIVVPLTGRTGVVGAITLIHAESGRVYNSNDLSLAEDLARRAATAVETAHAFREQSTRLADVLRVAEAAQHAILAQPPAQVGQIALAARYVSAAAEALVGGDLYEITARPNAVRLLIGDVRGKGLEAVRVATIVLGEFRAAAADLDDLAEVARQIDRRVRHYLSDEDFVTALIADVNDDGTYTFVNCGHPSPLLATGGRVRELESDPSVPLGLGVDPVVGSGVLAEGDRLLLYTDGMLEARNATGEFVDLMTVAAPLAKAPLELVLDDVLHSLQRWTGGPLSDDLALLLAEYRGSSQTPEIS